MKKVNNVTDATLSQLKNDIRSLSVRIFLMKEQNDDLEFNDLHEIAELLRETANSVDQWGQEKF